MKKNHKKMKLLVEGIICTGCATDTENILLEMDGIIDATVDFAQGLIIIEYESEDINVEKIFRKIKGLNFNIKKTEDF